MVRKGLCVYCGQEEKLDGFGYCIKYNCFYKSGENKILDNFIIRARKLYDIPAKQMRQISGPVSNFYNVRNREANKIMDEARLHFGFVPTELLKQIPIENQKQWDKNIRW